MKDCFSKLFLSALLVLVSRASFGHQSVWVSTEKNSYLELEQIKPSSQIETFWVSPPIESGTEEPELALQTDEKRFTLKIYPDAKWLRIKIPLGFNHRLYLVSPNQGRIKLKPWIDSHLWDYSPKFNLKTVQLVNHSHLDNLVSIEYIDRQEQILLAPYESVNLTSSKLRRISAQYRTAWIDDSAWEFKVASSSRSVQKFNEIFNETSVKFLLTNSAKNSSYIAEINDPELISAARKQIQYPNQAMNRVMIAEISYNDGQINKDYFHPSKSPWSWKISKVVAFSFFGQQSCDGNPQYLDEFFMLWFKQKRSICFWDYQITKELP